MDLLGLSDPFVVVSSENSNGVWEEIGRTEIVVNNLKYGLLYSDYCLVLFLSKPSL